MEQYRQQQEQEEIQQQLEEALLRVIDRTATLEDARLLAWASGIRFDQIKGARDGAL